MPSNIQIRLATDRVNYTIALNQRIPKIYTPGEVITKQNEFMRLEFCILLNKSFPITNLYFYL